MSEEFSMDKDNFMKWLEESTELSTYSISRYAGAIDTLSSELMNYGLNERNLYNVTDKNSIASILNNPMFQEKNKKGNRMYSAALNHFAEYIEHSKSNKYPLVEKRKPILRDQSTPFLTNKELINHIHSYIESKGFHYSIEEVTNLFLSIKTKPFVILSGISGTGKTKIVQWFAESVGATEENDQFALIPVRPDWNDSSDLLGYVDIKDDFKMGPLTKVIEKADENPELPYFVLLDEMNLARVEHYFSDILSVMESRKWQNGKIVTSNILTEEIAKKDIKLPTNLYIIGTVNMDETTYPFSKKVLDRANTIEFNRVELTNLSFLEERNMVEAISVPDSKFRSRYLHLKDLYGANKDLVVKVTNELEKINKPLQLINAHVGYRVRDEICFYLDYNEDGDLLNYKEAFDHCILQKILPRISGSDRRVEQLLSELYILFTGRAYKEGQGSYQREMDEAKYPNSAAKVLEMLRRLRDDGFTSFWIS
jgi:5-methylcytosine-specific restriction endonuclease McrBC GTP-binding regulatory subunit McrB